MTTHGQNLRVFAAWSDVRRPARGRPLPDREPVLPLLRLQGGLAGLPACAARRALPHAVFDVAGGARAHRARAHLACCPARRRSTSRSSRTRSAASYDLSSLRLAVTGAAAIPVELIHRMRDELGFETVITAYGLTESCGTVSMCRPTTTPRRSPRRRAARSRASRCAASTRRAARCRAASPARSVVRGYNVMRGYFEDPEETREGDRRRGLAAHRRRRRDGRARLPAHHRPHQGHVHRRRLQLLPGRDREPDVRAAAASRRWRWSGVPDERMGEVGVAFVVPRARARRSRPTT